MIANFLKSHRAPNSLMNSKIATCDIQEAIEKEFAATQIYKLHVDSVYNRIHNLARLDLIFPLVIWLCILSKTLVYQCHEERILLLLPWLF